MDDQLAERIALALHLNSKRWPTRKKHVAIDYSEYGRLAKAIVAALKVAGWSFRKKPPAKHEL